MTAEERKKKKKKAVGRNGGRDFQDYGKEPENGDGQSP